MRIEIQNWLQKYKNVGQHTAWGSGIVFFPNSESPIPFSDQSQSGIIYINFCFFQKEIAQVFIQAQTNEVVFFLFSSTARRKVRDEHGRNWNEEMYNLARRKLACVALKDVDTTIFLELWDRLKCSLFNTIVYVWSFTSIKHKTYLKRRIDPYKVSKV